MVSFFCATNLISLLIIIYAIYFLAGSDNKKASRLVDVHIGGSY